MVHLRALLATSSLIFSLLTIAAAQEQTLKVGTPIERQLAAGQSHDFSVTAEENIYVQLVVVQSGIDVVVRVSGPDGKSLGSFDTPNGNQGPENVSFVAATAGTYRINVTPLNQDATEGTYEIKIIEMREATEQELKSSKNKEGLKEKGVALLGEAEGLIQEIRTPQTRIKAQLQAAQMLGELDEKRSNKFLNDAATGLKELVATVDPTEQSFMYDHNSITQLRHEIVQTLANRDADAALSFLQASRLPFNPYGNERDMEQQETALELMVADQIVAKDPKRAYEIVRRKLKTGYSSNLLNTIAQIRGRNPELATELANEIAGKLLQDKLLQKPDAAGITIALLFGCRGRDKTLPVFERRGMSYQEQFISQEMCRDLFQKALQEALSYSPPAPNLYTAERDAAWNLLNGLQQLGPSLNEAVNGGLASVEKKLSELTVTTPDSSMANLQRLQITMNGKVEEAVAAIEEAPDEAKEQLYIQLANASAGRGDSEAARRIINERVTNPYQRRQALQNLEQQLMYNAMSQGRVEDALKAVNAMKSPRERANMLMQIARQIGPGYKRAAAMNLLEQARSMLAPSLQAQDQDQLNALLELARAFARYDTKRAFEIVDPLIDQLNELCAAARTLDGFGVEYYKGDELEMVNGNNLASLTQNISTTLGTLALANFERAKITSDRMRLPEVRLRAYMDIAQQAIQASK
jgi:hypothetical protein